MTEKTITIRMRMRISTQRTATTVSIMISVNSKSSEKFICNEHVIIIKRRVIKSQIADFFIQIKSQSTFENMMSTSM